MNRDSRAWQEESSWSGARRASVLELLRALDRSPAASNANTREALFVFVDVLTHESLAPEAVVISLKEVLVHAPALQRLEPLLRDQMRAALVSACIDRYFDARSDDLTREISSNDASSGSSRPDVAIRRIQDSREEHPR